MSSLTLLRTALRSPAAARQGQRQSTRFASSTTDEAAAKAKEAAAKLQEAAGPALDKAKAVFGGVADKAGGMLGGGRARAFSGVGKGDEADPAPHSVPRADRRERECCGL